MSTETYLSASQVAERYNIFEKTPWKWAREGKNGFPSPVQLSERCTRWKKSELEAWEAKQAGGAA